MKKSMHVLVGSVLVGAFLFGTSCKNEVDEEVAAQDEVVDELAKLDNISIFTDLIRKSDPGLINTDLAQTIFIPTDEAFKQLQIEDKREYDNATMIAFVGSQMVDKALSSSDFKSGKMTMMNTDIARVYDGRAFTQIEDALVEQKDLTLGNLTVHLVDRLFSPEIMVGHDHNDHSGDQHSHDMKDNCGTAGPSQVSIEEATALRSTTSMTLNQLPTWLPTAQAPRSLPNGYSLMGGRNDGLPYIHYFNQQYMEDGKFMDPNAPEGLMYGLTADGNLFPISAIYMTREATPGQLHDLNCIYMFHEHEGLPGVMLHVFHEAYPSSNRGFDHEADPLLVREMTVAQ